MRTPEMADGPRWAGSVSAGISLGALIVLIAKRLSLGIDVAAAKFISGDKIDDPVREEQILAWVVNTPVGESAGSVDRVRFFRDQMAANKVIQQALHEQWRRDPAGFPGSSGFTGEIRPRLDVVNRHMLLMLPNVPRLSSEQLSAADDMLDRKLASRSLLGELADARRTAARTALRSLGEARQDLGAAGAHAQ